MYFFCVKLRYVRNGIFNFSRFIINIYTYPPQHNKKNNYNVHFCAQTPKNFFVYLNVCIYATYDYLQQASFG